jgi:hypothetical protein
MFDNIRKFFGLYTTKDFPCVMSQGNHKIAKNVKIFNLPAIDSCPNCSLCAKNCYAKRAEKRFPIVRSARMRNFSLAKFHKRLLKKIILRDLQAGDIVRVHESGDFFNEPYINMWYEIALERSDIKFYAYTKNQNFPFERFRYLMNFNVINSILPDGSMNFGKENVVRDKAILFNADICPCRRGQSSRTCMVSCTQCLTAKKMLFIAH